MRFELGILGHSKFQVSTIKGSYWEGKKIKGVLNFKFSSSGHFIFCNNHLLNLDAQFFVFLESLLIESYILNINFFIHYHFYIFIMAWTDHFFCFRFCFLNYWTLLISREVKNHSCSIQLLTETPETLYTTYFQYMSQQLRCL